MATKIKITVKYPNEFEDDEFFSRIDSTDKLVEKSKRMYLERLREMQSVLFDEPKSLYWIIKHPIEFKDALIKWGATQTGREGNKGFSLNSLVSYYRVMISLFTHYPLLCEKNKELREQWHNLLEEFKLPVDIHYFEGDMTPRQQLGFIPFEKLVELREKLEIGCEARLLFALYTMIPPVRSDYGDVKIFKERSSDIDPDKSNLILSERLLTIKHHKSSHTKGPIVIHVPDDLMVEIQESLRLWPRKYLFQAPRLRGPYKADHWNHYANELLHEMTGNPHFSLTTFRHAYLSQPKFERTKSGMGLVERKKIAKQMGHDVRTQLEYTFNVHKITEDNPDT
jgi:integrase